MYEPISMMQQQRQALIIPKFSVGLLEITFWKCEYRPLQFDYRINETDALETNEGRKINMVA